eukprot:scaffold7736_cov621-Pinguiococcus_pyrenoidosus.AAC.1
MSKLAAVPSSAGTARDTVLIFLSGLYTASSCSGPSLKRSSHCSRASVAGSCGQLERPATVWKTGVP